MKQIVNITVPSCWQELSDKQMRFLFGLLTGEFSLSQIQTMCLIKWSGLKVLRREGAIYVAKYKKQVFPLSAQQLAEAQQALNWIGDFPVYPVRLSKIGFHKPLPANFQGVKFGEFLALDNLYQGYLQTKKNEIAVEMAKILYQSTRIHRITPIEEINTVYWFTSLKRYFADMFRHYFKQSDDNALAPPIINFSYLQKNMNTQIRALTGGDITKEEQVLNMDVWRALTELDAKAKDFEEMERNRKKK